MGKLEDLAKAKEKYLGVKKSFNKSPIFNLIKGNYGRLEKYYSFEIKRIKSKYS